MKIVTSTQELSLEGFNTESTREGCAHVQFDNGYGASIIHHEHSYGYYDGLFEVAVLYNGDICYTTPITDDVLGHLTADAVISTLQLIEQLK